VVEANRSEEELRELSLRVSREAAGLLRKLAAEPSSSEKVVEGGEAIRADVEAEKLILEILESEGFAGKVVTEERGVFEMGGEPIAAVIDPLDGSRNFSRGIRWSSISIAFAERFGNGAESIIAGCVYPVFWDEPVSFSREEGVFLGAKKVSREDAVEERRKRGEDVYLAVYADERGALEQVKRFYDALSSSGWNVSIRSLGSAALELAYVALGRIDAFIDARSRLRIVDAAAGIGMVYSQGGRILEIGGRPPEMSFDRMHRFRSLLAFLDEDIGSSISLRWES